MKIQKILPVLLAVAAFFLVLNGCANRVRTTGELAYHEYSPPAEKNDPDPKPEFQPPDLQSSHPETIPPETENTTVEPLSQEENPAQENSTQDIPTQEDPEAENKEYSGDAPAKYDPEGENSIVSQQPETEAPSAPFDEPGAPETGRREDTSDEENNTISETLPAEEADEQVPDEEAQHADTHFIYFQTLLDATVSDLFECEKYYVYWETDTDYTTVLKVSPEHQIILNAGGYNVSAKLTEETLTVDDGWIGRKNPGVIVKCVGTSVLGSSISGTGAAKAVRDALLARSEWSSFDAVAGQRVLILSHELLQTEAGRVAAAVFLACLMYPDELCNVDAQEACRLLLEEAGENSSGIYSYAG